MWKKKSKITGGKRSWERNNKYLGTGCGAGHPPPPKSHSLLYDRAGSQLGGARKSTTKAIFSPSTSTGHIKILKNCKKKCKIVIKKTPIMKRKKISPSISGRQGGGIHFGRFPTIKHCHLNAERGAIPAERPGHWRPQGRAGRGR